MSDGYIYKCPKRCPINKHCFVIKLENELTSSLAVLKKCDAKKGRDIRIRIGNLTDNEKHH